MGQDVADVTIHIDETLDHAGLEGIAGKIREQAGVVSVTFHDNKPHLMIVRYDPGKTASTAIHRIITDQGVHAELIGL